MNFSITNINERLIKMMSKIGVLESKDHIKDEYMEDFMIKELCTGYQWEREIKNSKNID